MKILSVLELGVTYTDDKAYISKWVIVDGDNTLVGNSLHTLLPNLRNRLVYIQDIQVETSYLINFFINNDIPYIENTSELKQFRRKNKNDCLDNWWSILRSPKGTVYKLEFSFRGSDCEIRNSRAVLLNSVSNIAYDWGLIDNTVLLEIGNFKQDDMIQAYDRGINENEEQQMIYFAKSLYDILVQVRKRGCQLTAASNAQKDWIRRDKDKFNMINYKLPEQVDKDIRKAYRGGLIWNRIDTLDKDLGHGYILDMNSIYAYVQKYFRLPCGEPIHIENEIEPEQDEFVFSKYTISADIKPEGIPCISDKTGQLSLTDECLTHMEDLSIWLSQYDKELLFNNYNVYECTFQEGYLFDTVEGLFNNFIEYWYPIKQGSKGVDRNMAKGYFTTAYGSIGKKNITEYIPVIINNELRYRAKLDSNNKKVQSIPKFRYIPVPAAITSIARWLICNKARECCKEGLICAIDTDAIHIICDNIPKCIVIGNELGMFKIEAEFNKIRHLGPKTYGYIDMNGNKEYKISGGSDMLKNSMDWDRFHKGEKFSGCKSYPFHLDGGVIRKNRTYTL